MPLPGLSDGRESTPILHLQVNPRGTDDRSRSNTPDRHGNNEPGKGKFPKE